MLHQDEDTHLHIIPIFYITLGSKPIFNNFFSFLFDFNKKLNCFFIIHTYIIKDKNLRNIKNEQYFKLESW